MDNQTVTAPKDPTEGFKLPENLDGALHAVTARYLEEMDRLDNPPSPRTIADDITRVTRDCGSVRTA